MLVPTSNLQFTINSNIDLYAPKRGIPNIDWGIN
jgi:hypothetical protein